MIIVGLGQCNAFHLVMQCQCPIHPSKRIPTQSSPFFSLPSFSTWRTTNAGLNKMLYSVFTMSLIEVHFPDSLSYFGLEILYAELRVNAQDICIFFLLRFTSVKQHEEKGR